MMEELCVFCAAKHKKQKSMWKRGVLVPLYMFMVSINIFPWQNPMQLGIYQINCRTLHATFHGGSGMLNLCSRVA